MNSKRSEASVGRQAQHEKPQIGFRADRGFGSRSDEQQWGVKVTRYRSRIAGSSNAKPVIHYRLQRKQP